MFFHIIKYFDHIISSLTFFKTPPRSNFIPTMLLPPAIVTINLRIKSNQEPNK